MATPAPASSAAVQKRPTMAVSTMLARGSIASPASAGKPILSICVSIEDGCDSGSLDGDDAPMRVRGTLTRALVHGTERTTIPAAWEPSRSISKYAPIFLQPSAAQQRDGELMSSGRRARLTEQVFDSPVHILEFSGVVPFCNLRSHTVTKSVTLSAQHGSHASLLVHVQDM